MSKIKMLQTTPGALDGIHIRLFSEGIPYSIPDQITQSLADLFVDMGVAKVQRERKPLEPDNTSKNLGPSEINDTDIDIEDDTDVVEEDDEIEDEIEDDTDVEDDETEDKIVAMRVFQLADELNMASKDIIKTASELGIHAPHPQSGLSEDEVERIKKGLS